MMMFIVVCVASWILCAGTMRVTGLTIDDMYLTANSHSMYKKVKPELKKKNRFLWVTRLCFWNAKSQKTGTMRFLIVLNTIAVLSIATVVLFVPALFTDDYKLTGVCRVIYTAFFLFHVCCIWGVSAWSCGFLNKKLKKKRSPRK